MAAHFNHMCDFLSHFDRLLITKKPVSQHPKSIDANSKMCVHKNYLAQFSRDIRCLAVWL